MALYNTQQYRQLLDGQPWGRQPSPWGGTTSLPQYLQQRQPGSTQPAQSGTSPTIGTQIAGVVGSQPQPPNMNPTSTAPRSGPAIQPPAPQGQQPGPQMPAVPPQAGAIGLENLRGVIERQLGTPSRYDSELVQSIRQQGTQRLQDEANLLRDRAKADASARGVYHGTPLTSSLGDIDERYLRGLSDFETNLTREAANVRSQDMNNAIGAAMGFGREQRADTALQSDILARLAQIGMYGAPTIGNSVDAFSQLPIPGGGSDMSALFALLGRLYG